MIQFSSFPTWGLINYVDFGEADQFLLLTLVPSNTNTVSYYQRDSSYKLNYIQINHIKGDPIFGGMKAKTDKTVANG